MLRVVLPRVVTASIRDIVLAVVVVHKVVIDVDIDVVVSPSGTPAPPAAPRGSHRHSHSERNRHACGVISGGRINDRRIGVNCGAVYHHRVIAGNVDDLGIGLLNNDYLFFFDLLSFNFLLLRGFKIP